MVWLNCLLVARAPLNPFGSPPTAFSEETDTTRHTDTAALQQEQQRIIEGYSKIFLLFVKRNDMFLPSRARSWTGGIVPCITATEGYGDSYRQ